MGMQIKEGSVKVLMERSQISALFHLKDQTNNKINLTLTYVPTTTITVCNCYISLSLSTPELWFLHPRAGPEDCEYVRVVSTL